MNMRVELESTSRCVEFVIDGVAVPARIWEGRTEKGVHCTAFITRIAALGADDRAEFDADLQATEAPGSAEVQSFPLRMVL